MAYFTSKRFGSSKNYVDKMRYVLRYVVSRAVGTGVPGVHVHPLFFGVKGHKVTYNFENSLGSSVACTP